MNIEILTVGPLKTNCYLVYKDSECLIIDPGAEENNIIKTIEDLELKPLAIFLTHDHFDHNIYAKSLSELYDVEIYDYKNLFEDTHHIGPFNFEVIYTPGHSSSSITFYFRNYNIMFVGDFIFKDNIGRVDLPTGNYQEMIESINKIKKYDDDIVLYPGHGDSTTLGHEKKHNYYFQ